MKKTLIACSVLLSSVALAETQTHTFTSTTGTNFNTELQNYLLNVGYKPGDKFSITLTMAGLGNAGTNLFTLIPDSYYVVNQQLQYFALSTSSSSVTTANVGSITFDSTSKVHTYTNVDGQKISLWTQSDTASVGSETSATRTVGVGLTLTVFDDGTNTGVALAYSAAGGHTDKWVLTGVDFDASKLAVSYGSTEISNATITVDTNVPEPATATLSLLALAGLVVRRRRKQA